MNKRNLLLVGAGVVIGYLLVGIINKNKAVSGATTDTASLPDTSSQTVPPTSTDTIDTTGTTPPIIGGAIPSRATLESV